MMMKTASNFPDLSKALVMGILNVTPDSFYDGGKFHAEKGWLQQIEKMIMEGAAIIDIGAASSRPGALGLSSTEEWTRLNPVLKSGRKHFPEICISVDTYHSDVAEKAISAGADVINDISGGTFSGEEMMKVVGKNNTHYVMMHMQGMPHNMQEAPAYENVVAEIKGFFQKQIRFFNHHGAYNIILDPGFGFGKDQKQNYTLLHNLKEFDSLGYPVMVGVSRKSMINKVLEIGPDDALNGTTVLNTIALMKGAKILRVHDVKEAVEAVKLLGTRI